MNMENFEKNDWAHMHDCIVHVTGRRPTQEEMEKLFLSLPEDMKGEAREWGMWDTLWRDNFIDWLEKEALEEVLNEVCGVKNYKEEK